MDNRSRQSNVCLEDHNQRRDVRAYLGWQDTERTMGHVRDIVLKEERYEATTYGEWVVINFTTWHDDCSVLSQTQVDMPKNYWTKLVVRHWRSLNEEDNYPLIATRRKYYQAWITLKKFFHRRRWSKLYTFA